MLSNIILGLVVFVATFCLDLVWAGYTRSIADHKRLPASVYAGFIMLLGGIVTVEYVHTWWLLVIAVIGSVAGTWFSFKDKA